MSHRALVDAWAAGRPAFGGWISSDSRMLLRAVSAAGFDWVGLDCQHGALDEAGAAAFIRELPAAACALLVRVSQNSPAAIGRVLDAGADGVIVPLVNDAAEARAAVSAVRYPPEGVRSYGPTRSDLPSSPGELQARADCYVMIETARGLANADEILSVPGVTGVFVGPSDLSVALGLPPRDAYSTDQLVEPLGRVRQSCERHQVVFGMFSPSPQSALRWRELGATMIVIGSELGLFNVALRQALDLVHGRT
jgi:4-hydroxy-2-oxoheptanedioate aldolase